MSKTKKTIIYIGGFELPDKNAAAQRVIANGKIFSDLGYEVVFVGVNKDLDISSKISHTKKQYINFDIWEVPYPKNKKEWLKKITIPTGLEEVISNYKSSLFAIICYNYPAIAQYRIKNICKKAGAYYISDVTEWYASSGQGILQNSIKWLDTVLRMKLFNFQADGLITTSKYLTKYYSKHISNIVELPTLFDSNALNQTAAKENYSDKKYLLYAGSPFNVNAVNKNKSNIKDRLDKVISLLSKIDDNEYLLNIYGINKENYLTVYPEHKVLLEKLGNNIVFNGKKTHKEIIKNIKESDFTIFFRDIDRVTEAGFPSKYSESITCGTPVITNLISNIEPYAVNGKNSFLIDQDNEDKQLAEMKSILLLTSEEISEMKRYCKDSKAFDYRRYTQSVGKFLNKLDTT